MVIDERKNYNLINYQNVRRGGVAVDSDHYTQYMNLDLKFESETQVRVEMYNFKNKLGQEKFKKIMSETNNFSKCFESDAPVLLQIENWRNNLDICVKKSFKKIRINKRKNEPLKEKASNLIDERNKLINQKDELQNKDKISAITEAIAEEESKENHEKILKNFKSLSGNP